MAFRFDDAARTLSCSVRDIVEQGFASGHLSLEVVRSRQRRMAEGRAVHEAYQAARSAEDEAFAAEQVVRHTFGVDGWTVKLHGRVDGLTREAERTLVEEIKSVALDHDRLYATELGDWPEHAAQLEVYLWMLVQQRHVGPVGRLVLVSIVDGSRHVLGITTQPDEVEGRVRAWLSRVIAAREDRLAWLAARRSRAVPWPFDGRRPGQAEVEAHVVGGLDRGRVALVEAPTGLGKTAAVLVAALQHALAEDRQVYWATARTTQQAVAVETAARLVAAGLPLRVVVITAKDKACLNEVVSCRPDACPFAYLHHDKVDEHGVLARAWDAGLADREVFRELGTAFEVCPYQLASDAARNADLVIGDYNYAFDPDLGGNSLFGEGLERWVVVVDEAHQLVERARAYGSPGVEARPARRARQALAQVGSYQRFVELCDDILDAIEAAAGRATSSWRRGEACVDVDEARWGRIALELDDVGVDYAILKADRPAFPPEAGDPWLDTARAVLRFREGLDRRGEETVALSSTRPGQESLRLLCLDPSGIVGPRIGRLGGVALCSATLSPERFYRDLLGLDGRGVDTLRVASPFPPERRHVVIAPRVSTRFRDREAHAPDTAALLQALVEATPGNVALYFPSFAMLDDLVERLDLGDREILWQRSGLSEAERASWLARLREGDGRTVLAAVLGGIFAEGVDLPGGALRTVVVVGPALPPVGLERDLLREWYEHRYGSGFLYASLIPGMTKVVQAAGRLVRGPDDFGSIVLVGQRFRWRDHADLLPGDWDPITPEEPGASLRGFFARVDDLDAVPESSTPVGGA